MFSQNRYKKRAVIKYLKSEYTLWPQYINEISLGRDNTGLIYQWPTPKIDVDGYYKDDQFYTVHVKAKEWFEKERREYSSGLWNPYFDFLISRMNPGLPLLDVGCGAGWFMHYYMFWKRFYYRGVGVEPSNLAKKYANPFVKPFIYDRVNYPDFVIDKDIDSFNVLVSLTLEHVADPVKFIQQYLPYVGKKGTLTIVVPNDFSPLQEWLGTMHFIQDVHVNYFMPDSLSQTVGIALSETDNIPDAWTSEFFATFPMELFELLGFHYIENSKIGAKCHRYRLLFEKIFKKQAFKLYQTLFYKYGWGRELVYTIRPV